MKLANKKAKLTQLLRPAIEMYRSGATGKRAFTKDHIKAILLFAFSAEPKSGRKKSEWLDQLNKLNDEDSEGMVVRALSESERNERPPLPPLAPENSMASEAAQTQQGELALSVDVGAISEELSVLDLGQQKDHLVDHGLVEGI